MNYVGSYSGKLEFSIVFDVPEVNSTNIVDTTFKITESESTKKYNLEWPDCSIVLQEADSGFVVENDQICNVDIGFRVVDVMIQGAIQLSQSTNLNIILSGSSVDPETKGDVILRFNGDRN